LVPRCLCGFGKIEKILNVKIENVEEAQEERFPLFDLTEAYKVGTVSETAQLRRSQKRCPSGLKVRQF